MKRLKTEGIVIHRAEVFTEKDYHLIIWPDGTVKENVPIDDVGEHAIAYNRNTIGIAVVGCFAALEKAKLAVPTAIQITTLLRILRELNLKYGNRLWIAGHSQLGALATRVPEKLTFGHTCPGERFPLADVIAQSGLFSWPLVVTDPVKPKA